jgi:hypothetical protein
MQLTAKTLESPDDCNRLTSTSRLKHPCRYVKPAREDLQPWPGHSQYYVPQPLSCKPGKDAGCTISPPTDRGSVHTQAYAGVPL